MIVRLKEFPKVLHKCNIPKFQFYDSPIKSLQALVRLAVILTRFNSMIVRLKVSENNSNADRFRSFNSMIVRLKELIHDNDTKYVERFQFYDSPIKRDAGNLKW